MSEIGIMEGTNGYGKAVDRLIKNQINHNPVGKIIIQAIVDSPHRLVIRPLSDHPDGLHCEAVTYQEDRLTAAPKGVGGKAADVRQRLYKGDQDDPNTDDDERFNTEDPKLIATGGGSNVQLFFTPGEWGGKSGCFAACAGTQADEALFHEMVHAQRIMQGLYNRIPTVNAGYDNEEEFLAIVTANVYISAKGGTRFVADHASCRPLTTPMNTSKGFVDDRRNSWLFSQHFTVWQPVFRNLASLDPRTVKFNPFREFVSRL